MAATSSRIFEPSDMTPPFLGLTPLLNTVNLVPTKLDLGKKKKKLSSQILLRTLPTLIRNYFWAKQRKSMKRGTCCFVVIVF